MRTLFSALLVALLLQAPARAEGQLRIFAAANFNPVLSALKPALEKELDCKLAMEFSGSQLAARKLTELKRDCDILLLADSLLFKKLASTQCLWRIDFACDSMALGFGSRAKKADRAERDWLATIQDPAISWGRVDENLAPVGYRTLLLLKLADPSGSLLERMLAKCDRKCDDASSMAALLRNGDLDYGFLYKSACLNYDIRFVELPASINMGSTSVDYSAASVGFKDSSGAQVEMKGSAIRYAFSIPASSESPELAAKFARAFLASMEAKAASFGLTPLKPSFHGPKGSFKPFESFSVYGGEL